jgi:hypothetical protein
MSAPRRRLPCCVILRLNSTGSLLRAGLVGYPHHAYRRLRRLPCASAGRRHARSFALRREPRSAGARRGAAGRPSHGKFQGDRWADRPNPGRARSLAARRPQCHDGAGRAGLARFGARDDLRGPLLRGRSCRRAPAQSLGARLDGPGHNFRLAAVVGGLVRMLLPIRLAALAANFAADTGFIAGEAIVLLLIGALLSYKAYTSG